MRLRSPIALAALMLTAGCADPTAIDVTVYSEVPCSRSAEVALTLVDDPQSLPSTTGAVSCLITGLKTGTAYSVTVTTFTAAGLGPPSAPVSATPD